MKYNLSNKTDKDKAIADFKNLLDKKATVDLSEERPIRSIASNSYLHVLFSLWGIQHGYSLKCTKMLIKTACTFTQYDSKTSEMTDKEMIDFIGWFRNYSSIECNYHLPSAEEYKKDRLAIDKEVSRHKVYL